MKAVGCFVLVMVVAFAGFFALVGWSITRGDDMSALTQRVELTVIDPREDSRRGNGYAFDYAYEIDGQWYGHDDWIKDDYWSPGQGLTACIDPDRPQDHVMTLYDEECGQPDISGNFIIEATPRPAPR